MMDEKILNVRDVQDCVDKAGLYEGLGDFRVGCPKGGQFGTFEGTVKEEK